MSSRIWTEAEALRYAKLKAEVVAQLREETGEEVDPDDEFLIGTLEGMTNLPEMVDFLGDRVRQNEAELDGLKVTAANYAEYMRAVIGKKTVQIERGKKRLLTILDMVGQKKIGRVSRREPSQRPVTILDEEKLPARFWVQPDPPKPRVDKIAVRDALKDPVLAQELDGIARFDNGAPTVKID